MKKSKTKKTTKVKKTSKAKRVAKPSPYYAESKRLGFRLLQESDEGLYCDLYTDAKTMEFVGQPMSKERAAQSFKKALEITRQKPFKQHISVIVEKATKKTIGITSLKLVDAEKRRAEGGILLKASAAAQRYAAEAVQVTNAEAFKWHAIDELSARLTAGHTAGERLVKGVGFVHGADVPATEAAPARSLWVVTRESWARNCK